MASKNPQVSRRFCPQRARDLLPPQEPNEPHSFDAAILDFDGTIALSGPIWHEVDSIFFARRHLPLEADVPARLAMLGFKEGARYLIERYSLSDTPDAIMNEWNELAGELYAQEVVLRPGVEEYLARLRHAGIGLGLATTNHPEVIAQLAPRIVVTELFDSVVYAREVGAPKNDPDIYLETAWRLGAKPERSVVFEDIPFGLAAARRAGFATVGVVSGDAYQDVAALRATADLLLETWSFAQAPEERTQSA